MYTSAKELLAACEESGLSLAEMTLRHECDKTGTAREDYLKGLKGRLAVMRESGERARKSPLISLSGLTGGNAHRVAQLPPEQSYLGPLPLKAMAIALSTSEVNARMGKIVAAPTAGAAGILPAAILIAEDQLNLSEEALIEGLLVAIAIGYIIATNATVSGAEGGCQVECGAAAAMAAGALVYLRKGAPSAVFEAASFALINIMGLVCDPVGGLVEFPCALRNAGGVVNAMSAADLALAGVTSLVPFDEVVQALYEVGRALPVQYRETAQGGMATTPSARQACTSCGLKSD
ncbi:L-serine ammonia-lyase, iron-sulfur-dependent, subunit alpha [Peptococcus niger]|uniref:L-serine dehydratase n=1 Tax=Peptococcus niger TaxID=2741 RepID=A0A1G6Z8J3_PEPNI|nr:L-serine ammonia-lyase, iron-sulfur-dependent, subunit alpha [Peptococcus niger]SDD98613.1 L-serine ammonia-lyase [Peptococcus niger]